MLAGFLFLKVRVITRIYRQSETPMAAVQVMSLPCCGLDCECVQPLKRWEHVETHLAML